MTLIVGKSKELEMVRVKATGFVSYLNKYLLSDYKSYLEQDEGRINTHIYKHTHILKSEYMQSFYRENRDK